MDEDQTLLGFDEDEMDLSDVHETAEEEIKAPDQVEKQEDTAPKEKKTFTQDELDAIIEKRLSREKSAYEKQLKSNPILSKISEIATKNNMTEAQLLASWSQQEIEQRAEEDGITVEAAARTINAERRAEQAEAKLKELADSDEKAVKEQKEFADFVAEYKDVNAAEIPAEVWEMRERTGKSLSDCYEKYEAKQLKTKLTAAETLLKNLRKAPVTGGVGGNGTKTQLSDDPFLTGFDSD